MKKSTLNKVKQATAGLLTLAMVATGLPPMEARAATILQPNAALYPGANTTLQPGENYGMYNPTQSGGTTYGSSQGTAYAYGPSHYGSNTQIDALPDPWTTAPQNSFNIGAIVDPDAPNSNIQKGYNGSVRSAYSNNWWSTYYGFGRTAENDEGAPASLPVISPSVHGYANHVPQGPTTLPDHSVMGAYNSTAPFKNNGEVTEITVPAAYRTAAGITPATGDTNKIEVRLEVKPTDDKQKLLVVWTAYNPNSYPVHFWAGAETDTMIAGTDTAPTIVSEGQTHLHMMDYYNQGSSSAWQHLGDYLNIPVGNGNRNANAKALTDLDIKKSGGKGRVWSGTWKTTAGINHQNFIFARNDADNLLIQENDTAAAFSANLSMEAGQTASTTFEVSMRAAVYYVDSDPEYSGTRNGYISQPFSDIQTALDAMHRAKVKKGYIYVASPVTVTAPINVPDDLEVQIESSPYKTKPFWGKTASKGTYVLPDPASSAVQTITRGSGFTSGSMFNVSGSNTKLSFYNITLDGNKTGGVTATDPLVNITAGKVTISDGTTIQNAKTSGDGASAVAISGGTLDLNAEDSGKVVTITGNESTGAGAAVKIADGFVQTDTPVTINGNVQINNNTMSSGKGNVYLGKTSLFVKTGNTFAGNISVSVPNDRTPTNNDDGTPIVDFAGRTPTSIIPYSTSNFGSDKNGQTIEQADTSKNSQNGGAQQTGILYLRVKMRDLSISYVDENGDSIPYTTLGIVANPLTKTTAAGSTLNYPVPAYAGHKVSAVRVTPQSVVDTTHEISIGDAALNTLGTITGTMPDTNVDIVVTYIRNSVVYKYDSQGGTAVTEQVENVQAPPATSIYGPNNIPQPTRTGFVFDGWYRYNDADSDGKFDPVNSADTDISGGSKMTGYESPDQAKTITYYAKWNPGSTPYEVRTSFKNSHPSLIINFGSVATNHVITEHVQKDPVTIVGYKYVSGTYAPASAGTMEPAASATPGHFDIPSMPATNVGATYRYAPDPNQTFPFTVRHVDGGGTVIQGNTVTTQRRAEQSISAMPRTLTGYTYDHFTIDAGNADGANYAIGFGNFGFMISKQDQSTGEFTGYMLNQPVTITYHYTADAGMNLVRRYADGNSGKILVSRINPVVPNQTVAVGYTDGITTELYGYLYNGNQTTTYTPADSQPQNISVDGSGNISGVMPSTGSGARVDYHLGHDPAKWRDINFAVANAPYEQGSINPLPAGAPTSFLANDGSPEGNAAAYNFNKLKTDGYVPSLTPNRYYMFDGWYLDAAATMPVSDTQTFETSATPLTLYAKFVEDPSQWYDIHFVSGSNGSISAPASLHKPYDYTWGQIAGEIPTATPVVNYLFAAWTGPGGAVMGAASTLTNNATYTANFSKDPSVWGTNVGSFTGSGHIGYDGSGEIHINGSTPGNVYVISDMKGQIVAVVKGDPNGSLTIAHDLIPGAHYNVQEGLPDTQATVGQPVSSVTGSSVSAPQDVYIPTVEDNYNVGYDPENEGMAQIVINPADPDAEYALIDEAGNVLKYPGSDNGWMKPVGSNPSTVTFNNLNPNETYTVVARKKGDASIPDPLAKLPDGNQIVANPGDMADAQKYIVETRNGIVVSVGDTAVNGDAFDQAKPGDVVNIHADATNASGKAFKYWQVLAGRAVGVSGNITQNDYTFTLSRSNIVLKAVYETDKLYGDDANLYEEIRGGALGEFGLEPYQLANLAHELTTDADRELNSVNGATVDYKIVFNKRDASKTESNLVKPVSESGTRHQDAYTAAYALDILLERYVNGRKVDRATASNAVVDVIAQLPANDTDQLDYQLFDVTSGTPVEVTLTGDVANNAGLLKFTGNVTHTYVLVYSKVFKLVFLDNKPVLDHLHLGDTSRNFYYRFKVRRKESVEDSYYDHDYGVVTAYAKNETAVALKSPFEDIYGVQYDYLNWSKKEDTLSAYDTTSPVTKALVLYAYYKNNKPEVTQARIDLGNTIEEAQELRMDPYLKAGEAAHIAEAITVAQETLRRARGLLDASGNDYLRMANYEELQQAIRALRELLDRYKDIIAQRTANRNSRTGGSSGGGGSSYGKGSLLLDPGQKYTTKNRAALEASNVLSFVLGVDGNWARNPVTGGWSFVLNGGQPLNTFWGRISFPDATGRLINKWYYFDGQSTMVTGWLKDPTTGNWFFMNTDKNANEGQMVTGWIEDAATGKWYFMNEVTGVMMTGWQQGPQDGRWYYLGADGAMLTGWQEINGKLYYFNPVAAAPTYTWNAQTMHWDLTNSNARPYGAMYANEMTPDGHRVGADGARQ